MTEFVASNGLRVTSLSDGQVSLRHALPADSREYVVWMGGSEASALREFFRAERDAELGRWRSKEHPEYVVYPTADVKTVYVAAEDKPHSSTYVMGHVHGETTAEIVAREFFAAHPEPKPWHDAKPGEVWELVVAGRKSAWALDEDDAIWHEASTGRTLMYAPQSPAITAGRRIWPEVSHD